MVYRLKMLRKLPLSKKSAIVQGAFGFWIFVIENQMAQGLTGDWQISKKAGQYNLSEMFESDTSMVISDFTKGGPQQYLVNHPILPMIGLHEVNVEEIVTAIDPDFYKYWQLNQADISLNLTEDSTILGVRHKTYQVRFNQIEILDSYLRIHESEQQGITMIRWNLPHISWFPAASTKPQKDALERFWTQIINFPEIKTIAKASAKPVYVLDQTSLIPAWKIQAIHLQGHPMQIFIHGADSSVLHMHHDEFDIFSEKISVFDKNPKDGRMVETDMPLLMQTGYLDSKFFSVFGPKESKETTTQSMMNSAARRLRLENKSLNYSAHRPQDTQAFDQLQIYFYTLRSLEWLWDKFGLDPDPAKNFVSVFVGGTINGRYDNAMYLPSDEGPAVLIAQHEKLENLARDRDVVSHELAHHIIYRGIKSSSGESGVLHEGTADYLTYAQSSDPYLAESIVPGAAYLRTALMVGENPSEKLSVKMTNHARGQYWSALLWDLGEKVGHERVVQWISGMLHYVGPKAGLRDAFLGIIRTERDLMALASQEKTGLSQSSSLVSNPGESQECRILEAGLRWGFARYLTDFSGENCGLNIPEWIEKKAQEQEGATKKKSPPLYPLKLCGTLGSAHHDPANPIGNLWALALIASLPLIVLGRQRLSHAFLRKRRKPHGS